jgi:ankyrin repeat protein
MPFSLIRLGQQFARKVADPRCREREAVDLIRRNASLDETHDTWPPLCLAVAWNNWEVFDAMIKARARDVARLDVNATDGSGWNALMRAAWLGRAPYVSALLDNGANRLEEARELARRHIRRNLDLGRNKTYESIVSMIDRKLTARALSKRKRGRLRGHEVKR